MIKETKLSRENKFIIKILRCFLRPNRRFQHDDFNAIDWDRIIPLAKYHNILILIYHVLLKNKRLDQVPDDIKHALEKDSIEKTAFILQYEYLLKRVTDSLYQADIPFVILKGPALSYELYDPIELRFYGDLDLLINKHDYEKVRDLLSQHGFHILHHEMESHRRQYWNSIDFIYMHNENIAIDLHWDTLTISWGRVFLSGQDIWENTRWLDSPGMKLPVLSPIILIQHLCLHLAFHHQFGKLQTLCDLDLAIQKFEKEIDWVKLIEESYRLRIGKAVTYSMKLSETLLGTELPAAVQNAIKKTSVTERILPFSYLVFRSTEIPGLMGRMIRFLLIDDFRGKIQSMASFYQRLKALKSQDSYGGFI